MTHRPNPVQSIAQHRQQFSQPQYQPMQQPFAQPQQPVIAAEQQIQSQMHELAMEIYARLAVDHLRGDVDPEYLHSIAANSQSAARCYFEQLGVPFDARAAGS